MSRSDSSPDALDHEQLRVVRGRRSGVVIAVAVHSTQAGPAIGGCRITSYSHWRDGLDDVVRLSRAMTEKAALAGLPHGGGKSVIMDADAVLDERDRLLVLEDLAEVITSLDGAYLTGPDIGSTPEDMEIIHGLTGGLAFCRPESGGGSGNSSTATARGVLAALDAAADHVFGTGADLRVGVIGYGSVGRLVADELAARGCAVTTGDLDGSRRAVAEAAGLTWSTEDLLGEEFDVLVPAAVGGLLSEERARTCRARLIVGPANNQLTHDGVGSTLHERGVTWVPDVVASAGGIIHAVCREELGLTEEETTRRITAIGATVTEILTDARESGTTPQTAARDLAARRRTAVPA
ncbi:Glu/Leu/Phe/Val dehydrogenase [Saccharopolyspora karakumensis]|uniref:Glu/Leu/Phe/Val dehydrogenase n=1 Tax=Saccharopolyspora karakumensis TaxID=2530386 RepID=A0A4R5B6Y0_9PSEU|nr:Glu/Leu/Phe/Val dehydrogenase dimerization domain-containing protein [Saccharopolyspora karakumensis]TDD81641.1 Glu/Leu/Phe/Val dehydrogenase [Saccharopolyspora karakumensis]